MPDKLQGRPVADEYAVTSPPGDGLSARWGNNPSAEPRASAPLKDAQFALRRPSVADSHRSHYAGAGVDPKKRRPPTPPYGMRLGHP